MPRFARRSAWLALAASAAVFPCGAAAAATIQGRQLIVDGAPFHIKGVCWNPVPRGGVHPQDLDYRGFVAADAELMALAGINVVRTYEPINDTAVLDVLWEKRIRVLNTVYINAQTPVEEITKRVNAVKDHPAVLMWVVGNEWNYNGLYAGLPFPVALQTVKNAVDTIKLADPSRPVATVHGEIPTLETVQALASVDVWGINRYSGIDFGNLFANWASLSGAPMFLGEYGADAYDSSRSGLDEADQAKATEVLTGQIVQASSLRGGVCIGGFIFEFADELWKDGTGDPNKQDVGGVSPGSGPFPDFTFNEEWWGLVQYDGTPRKAFWAYARIPLPGAPEQALRGAGAALSGKRWREGVCGAHSGCRGRIGYCCPGRDDVFDVCCGRTTPSATTAAPRPSTTWVAPASPPAWHAAEIPGLGGTTSVAAGATIGVAAGVAAGGGGAATGGECVTYPQRAGLFMEGRFPVATLGCQGVGECQFPNLPDAEAFCNQQNACSGVLLHPIRGECAGGFGCYTPRSGAVVRNLVWDRSGGRAWVRSSGPCGNRDNSFGLSAGAPSPVPAAPLAHAAAAGPSPTAKYVFVGSFRAVEAQAACRHVGRLAMPKLPEEREALVHMFEAAVDAGKMSRTWPGNTAWLGGQFNPTYRRWMWNDGTPIGDVGWAEGQPSAEGTNQMSEPWLCMVLDGGMHDAAGNDDFAVFCEVGEHDDEVPVPLFPQQPSEVTAPADGRSTELPPPRRYGRYWLVGHVGPTMARHACGLHRRPVMPKSERDWRDLLQAVRDAVVDGHMSPHFPGNMLWLGARWSATNRRWVWDDGSPLGANATWAPGQPSAPPGGQTQEPWLCAAVAVNGLRVHDSPPGFSFGVMCEEGDYSERTAWDAAHGELAS